MPIIRVMRKQYTIAGRRNWDRVYWAIDLHSTLIMPNYQRMKAEDVEYYPHSLEVMQALSERSDAKLMMYTCSWDREILEYQKRFRADGILFDWEGHNPEVNQTEYGCYTKKPYFNILLDDKAGFDPDNDWIRLLEALEQLPVLDPNGPVLPSTNSTG